MVMASEQHRTSVAQSFVDTVRELLTEGPDGSARQAALEIFASIEAQLLDLVLLPPDKLPRVQKSLEAQLVGLLELARIEALRARRELILQGITTALQLARRIILKL